MVFHRFIATDARHKRFKLLLNGNEIKPWDPFCRSEIKTKVLQSITIPIDHEGVSGKVLIEPFVLPHQDDFSSPDAFRNASGPANWNQQQGFYIYRAGRMIQSGGWSNLRAPDEHMKLARIAVSFSPALDEAFKINVAKMRVQMPSIIRDAVREAIGPAMKLARESYDRKPARSPGASSNPSANPNTSTTPTTNTIQNHATTSSNGSFRVSPRSSAPAESETSKRSSLLSLEQWSDLTLKTATKQERPIVEAVLKRLQN